MPKPHIAEKRSQVAFEERRLVHVRLRLKMRYDLDIDLHEMREINRIIASGGGTGRHQEDRRALEVWIPLRGTPVCWEYLIPKQCVVTVLPPPPPMPSDMQKLALKDVTAAYEAELQQLRTRLTAVVNQEHVSRRADLIQREFDAYKLHVAATQEAEIERRVLERVTALSLQSVDVEKMVEERTAAIKQHAADEIAAYMHKSQYFEDQINKQNIAAGNNRYHRSQMSWVSTILKTNYQLIQGDPNWLRAMAILTSGIECPKDAQASQYCIEREARYVNDHPPTLVVPEIW